MKEGGDTVFGKGLSGGTIKNHPSGLLKLTALVTVILMVFPMSAEAWGTAEYNGLVHESGRLIPLPAGYVLEAELGSLLIENDPRGRFQEGLVSVREQATGFYGYMNYDWVSTFSEGVAVVRMNNRHGLVNLQGDLLWLKDYDTLSDFREGHSIASRGDDIWIVTIDGQQISFSSDIETPVFLVLPRQTVSGGDCCR